MNQFAEAFAKAKDQELAMKAQLATSWQSHNKTKAKGVDQKGEILSDSVGDKAKSDCRA